MELIFVLGNGGEGGEACGAGKSIVLADQKLWTKAESICKVDRLRIYQMRRESGIYGLRGLSGDAD